MINLKGITVMTSTSDRNNVILMRKCPFCCKKHSIIVKRQTYINGMNDVCRGVSIQNAFPTWTASEREFLMTGICDECWNNV